MRLLTRKYLTLYSYFSHYKDSNKSHYIPKITVTFSGIMLEEKSKSLFSSKITFKKKFHFIKVSLEKKVVYFIENSKHKKNAQKSQ